jgi:hypothetical protein
LLKKRVGLIALGALGVLALCTISGVVGGALSHHFGTSSYSISYADFISVMLTAVSVLLTALTIFLAVIGVLGWAAISNGVRNRTEAFLDEGFKEGNPLYKMVETRVAAIVYEGIERIEEPDGAAGEKGGKR